MNFEHLVIDSDPQGTKNSVCLIADVNNDGMNDNPQSNAEAGYIKVYVAATEYQIPFYNSA